MPHVAITGASSGIGEALVREFLAAGASVTMVARRRDLLEKIARETGGRTHIVEADLSRPDTVTDWIAPAEQALGPIDVMINNAGVQIVMRAEETDPAAARALIELDLWAPLAITRALLPGMLARGSGVIVDVASDAALAPLKGMWIYNAAKGGLANASEGLRVELRGTGVHVVAVYPGPVTTPMADAARPAYPDDVRQKILPEGNTRTLARMVRRAVEKKRARVIYPRFYWLTWWFRTITLLVIALLAPRPLPLAGRRK